MQRTTLSVRGASLPCQLLDRKENAEHGLLTIEVKLFGAGEAAFNVLAQCGPACCVGTGGETPQCLIFASDDLISFKLSARASRRYPNEDLQQQFPGNPVGVLCIGASEPISKGMQPDHIEPRDLRQHFEHRSIECKAAGIGELQSAPDTSVGQYRKRFRLRLREFRTVSLGVVASPPPAPTERAGTAGSASGSLATAGPGCG